MPRIVSFSHTTPALVNRHKTMTTRAWKPEYAALFKAGQEILAYSKSPRNGGVAVARLRLTDDVRLENPAEFTREDFQREGFGFLAATGELAKVISQVCPQADLLSSTNLQWRMFKLLPPLYVVRFELLELLPGAAPFLRPDVVPVELPEGIH